MIGQCNYGGRVTDTIDMRVLGSLLQDFLGDAVLQVNYSGVKLPEDKQLYVSKICKPYIFPSGDKSHESYVRSIKDMP
jgi:hypothetical protein